MMVSELQGNSGPLGYTAQDISLLQAPSITLVARLLDSHLTLPSSQHRGDFEYKGKEGRVPCRLGGGGVHSYIRAHQAFSELDE